jgi:CCR4-NOT transcriptional regulation complex NOT5 subunit
LHHPNIILFIGVCTEPLCIVVEFADRGSLMDVLSRHRRAVGRKTISPRATMQSPINDAAADIAELSIDFSDEPDFASNNSFTQTNSSSSSSSSSSNSNNSGGSGGSSASALRSTQYSGPVPTDSTLSIDLSAITRHTNIDVDVMSWPIMIKIAMGIVKGMIYLHSKDIIHRYASTTQAIALIVTHWLTG